MVYVNSKSYVTLTHIYVSLVLMTFALTPTVPLTTA